MLPEDPEEATLWKGPCAGLKISLILLIMALVLVMFALAERLERRLLRWRDG